MSAETWTILNLHKSWKYFGQRSKSFTIKIILSQFLLLLHYKIIYLRDFLVDFSTLPKHFEHSNRPNNGN